jgi:hypothetical protein
MRLAETFVAAGAKIALHDALLTPIKSDFLGFTIAAMTVHLTFRGQDLNFACIPQQIRNFRSMAFGCALSVFKHWQGFVFNVDFRLT